MNATLQCDKCGYTLDFVGYEYWEDDENGNAIILDYLVTDDPDLTPEDRLYSCMVCGTRWCYPLED